MSFANEVQGIAEWAIASDSVSAEDVGEELFDLLVDYGYLVRDTDGRLS